MLAIQPTNPQKCTPNLLPARIHHNGPINDTQRYWKPETDEKGTQHVYFRGRHLHGSLVRLPETYTGAVVNVTGKILPATAQTQAQSQTQTQSHPADEHDEDKDNDDEQTDTEDVKIAEQIGEFDSILVWEHGGAVDEEKDAYGRGVREWIGWAESMHVDGEDTVEKVEKIEKIEDNSVKAI